MVIDEILKFKNINKLKEVYRFATVGQVEGSIKRKENAAEHSWSAMMVANYFFTNYDFSYLNKEKIYELLLFHDLVEIESGDVVISPENETTDFDHRERSCAKILKEKLPNKFGNNFYNLFSEFQDQSTIEARFARAIEQLDAEIHELDYKEDYKGWTEEFLRKAKQKYFDEFPPLKEVFEEIVTYLRENKYFH
jgi:putative hydrolase of HD superfamily